MTALTARGRPSWKRRLLSAFAAGAATGVAGYLFGRLVLPDLIGPDALDGVDLRWSDAMAAMTAAGLIIGAVAVLILSLDARRLGRLYRLDEPAAPAETAQARFQAVVMGFSGVILLLPTALALAGAGGPLAFVVVAALLAVHTALNLRAWRGVDELLRRTTMEAATATFFLGQGLLFLMAAGERLGVLPPITGWDVYAVLMTLYLAASAVAAARRGLA